jgi:hypothetical protein
MALWFDAQCDIELNVVASEESRMMLDVDSQKAQIEAKVVAVSQCLCAPVSAPVPLKKS